MCGFQGLGKAASEGVSCIMRSQSGFASAPINSLAHELCGRLSVLCSSRSSRFQDLTWYTVVGHFGGGSRTRLRCKLNGDDRFGKLEVSKKSSVQYRKRLRLHV